ncbi:MAG: hypothetical protein HYY52_08105 [Candidatus Melainabacteria bacterium]|nr:hypothetical protein [Candidatus Melainabacteria bacterium]
MDIKKKFVLILLLSFCFLTTNIARGIIILKENNDLTKSGFIGKWNMQTVVTNSKCPYVIVGSTTESQLEIKDVINNSPQNISLRALWKGGKWTKSQSLIKLLNEKEAVTERVTKFKTNNNNKWKAILIDHLKLDENNIMHSESIVIQYKNDIFVGEYKTYSILTKAN